MRYYRSLEEARQAFDAYARLEPRLRPLWELCRRAAPPVREPEDVADVYDVDPFDVDVVAAGTPDDGWCAEQFFHDHVKSRLLVLAGAYRPGERHELHGTEAFEALYDLLLNWALDRRCACCADSEPHDSDGDGDAARRADESSSAHG